MNNSIKNIILTPFHWLYHLSPELELKILYRIKSGEKLNLENPRTYNEKLQWLKLYYRHSLMPQCCDKYLVRSYVESCGCTELLNDLYWQGYDPKDIPFDKLPDKFVIKVTHGSTFNLICTAKEKFDKTKAMKLLHQWLKEKFLTCYGEWYYGIERPRIIVEKYLESEDGMQLKDYKVFCFHGEPRYIRVDSGRFTKHHCKDTYNTEWILLKDYRMDYECSNQTIPKPKCLENMLEYARKLSAEFIHARVDFYLIHNRIIFGEITFCNGAGFDKITPKEFADEMGDYIKIPK